MLGTLVVLISVGTANAEQLAAYDFDTNTGMGGGDQAVDISGLGDPINVTLQDTATIVMDAERNSYVLNTGAGTINPDTSGPGLIGVGAVSDLSEGADNTKLNTTGSFTMAAWMKTSTTRQWAQLFGRGWGSERIYSYVEGEGDAAGSIAWALSNVNDSEGADLGFTWSGGTVPGTAGGDDGTWHHYALSVDVDAHTVTAYYDGQAVQSADKGIYSRNGSPATPAIGIGVRTPDLNDFLENAYIDDAVYWNEAADPNLIAAIASGAMNGTDVATIPEPTSLALILCGLAGLCARRKR